MYHIVADCAKINNELDVLFQQMRAQYVSQYPGFDDTCREVSSVFVSGTPEQGHLMKTDFLGYFLVTTVVNAASSQEQIFLNPLIDCRFGLERCNKFKAICLIIAIA